MIVYTAGPMNSTAAGRRTAPWRLDLVRLAEQLAPGRFSFVHPDGDGGVTGCDHGGLDPRAIVTRDVGLIDSADAVVGWLPRRDLYATHAELGYAVACGKRSIVYDQTGDEPRWEDEHTGHGCYCDGHTPYWFVTHLVALTGGHVLLSDPSDRPGLGPLAEAMRRWWT